MKKLVFTGLRLHVLNLLCKNLIFHQNKAEANGGGLRDPEALLREPDGREPAAEAGARAAAAVGGGGWAWALRPVVPVAGHGHGGERRLPVLRQGHRHERRRRDKRQELHQLLLLNLDMLGFNRQLRFENGLVSGFMPVYLFM